MLHNVIEIFKPKRLINQIIYLTQDNIMNITQFLIDSDTIFYLLI